MNAPSKHLCPSTAIAALLALVTATALVGSGCGGEDDVSATISNVTVEPESPFPGVETTITYDITDTSAGNLSWEVDFGDGTTQRGEGERAEAVHTYQSSSTFTVQLRALSGGDTIASRTTTVDVQPRVDLVASNARPRPSNVEPGDALTVAVDIENRAAAPMTTPIEVPIFVTRDQSTSLQALRDNQLDELGVAELTANEEGVVVGAGRTRAANLQLTVPEGISGGQWNVVPWLKSDGQFADTNPADNFTVSGSPMFVDAPGNQQADIAVTNVYALPDFAFPALNQFTHGFELDNVGGAEAPDVRARTYLSVGDTEIDDSDPQVATTDRTYDVPAGSSVTVGPNEVVLDSDITAEMGDKEVYVIVEAFIDTDVDDVNPDNNVATADPPITVSNERVDGPDIAVNSFAVTPTSTFLDGTLQISGEITNEGTSDVDTSFVCPIYLGEEPRVRRGEDQSFSQLNIPSLDSEESFTFDRTVTIPALYDPGTYYIYVVCDPSGAVNETYRNNNQKIFPDPVEVTDQANVDLFVDELSVPQQTTEGSTTSLTATVCVTGSNPSGETRAALYRTPGSSVNFTDDPVRTLTLPNVPPDECRDVQIERTAECLDFQETYSYGIEVDIDDTLPENNEDNNQTTGTNPVTVDGDYCSCTPDQYEPNDSRGNWATVQPGSTSASMCDAGGCDYFQVNDVAENESLVVETSFDADVGPLRTRLFDSSGLNQLDADSTPGRQQVATFNVPSQSDYTFTVCGDSPQARNLYSMNIETLPQPSDVDVIPRRPDLPAQSEFIIGESIEFDARIHNIGAQDSSDFDAEVIISPDRDIGDGDDVLMQPGTVDIDPINSASARDVTVNSSLPTSLSDGTYYVALHLDPSGTLSETNTDNNITVSNAIEVKTRCFDPLEPNDDFSSAASINSGSYSNLSACASAPDVYEICVADGKQFDVTANFDADKGDIDLQLFDEQLSVIDSSSQSNADTETVSEDYVNGDQCYYARAELVTTQQQLDVTYDMTLDIQSVPPQLQCDSTFEPNNYINTASSLINALSSPNASDPLTLDRCPNSDTDYYKVQLNQGQQVTFRGLLDPASQAGTLRLQLYNPSQTVVTSKQSSPGDSTVEITDYVAPQSGTYYLQASVLGSDRKYTYRLEGDGFGGIDLEADGLDFWSGTYSGGDSLFFDVDISNLRTGTATAPTLNVYYSTQSAFSASNATLLDSYTLNDVSGNSSQIISEMTTLPSSVQSGTQYIHVEVVPASGDTDANLGNNTDTRTITIGSP